MNLTSTSTGLRKMCRGFCKETQNPRHITTPLLAALASKKQLTAHVVVELTGHFNSGI
jgi:hypothetical protein